MSPQIRQLVCFDQRACVCVQSLGIEVHLIELVIIQEPASNSTSVSHMLHQQSNAIAGRFAYLVLQLPTDTASGSVVVLYAGDAIQAVALEDCFGATVTAAYCDCDRTLIYPPAACAMFVVYGLCLTDVRSLAALCSSAFTGSSTH